MLSKLLDNLGPQHYLFGDGSGFLGGSKNPIKSLLPYSITITAGNMTNTGAITSVDPNNAVVIFCGNTYSGATAGESAGSALAYVELTNATTVTATRGFTDDAITVYFYVLEFNIGVLNQNVQRGTIAMAAGDVTKDSAALTAVVLANTWLVWGGWTPTDTNVFATASHQKLFPALAMTSTTAARLSRNTSGTFTPKAPYQVVEFKVVG